VLKVVIDTEGKVIEVVPVQGDPLLAKACLDAVTKWKFRPYIRDNQKVEAESAATIEFFPATGEVRTPKPHPGPLRLRVSQGVADGLKLRNVDPKYPKEARKQHIQGDVILGATIDKQGNMANIRLISGDPLLAAAAIEAVRQWKYRPYLLNGQPVEVETAIKISFHL
jgi:TonB family protein